MQSGTPGGFLVVVEMVYLSAECLEESIHQRAVEFDFFS